MHTTTCHTVHINGHKIFYRAAGATENPVLLLLHGFPSSSHMFRNLMPLLADSYRLIAPDMPGFGLSAIPDHTKFTYTFEKLTDVIEGFTEALKLDNYAIYVFDYGAPVGLRLALRRPERVKAIISQNGNAYLEGLSEGWNPIQKYWDQPIEKNRTALRHLLSHETTYWQYTHGVNDQNEVSPEGYTLDSALLTRPGVDAIQLDLFLDYATNVKLYSNFQEYFRKHNPPLLAVWGKNDPFFLPAGAQAFKRDIPAAEIQFFDTGHFALETHHNEIAIAIRDFLKRTPLSV